MAASVWTGYLTFGLISMPVRLFSGARSTRISFHMLHRDDHTRVKQQLYCPAEDKVIDRSEVVKGYEHRKGEYVIIEPEELKKIERPPDRCPGFVPIFDPQVNRLDNSVRTRRSVRVGRFVGQIVHHALPRCANRGQRPAGRRPVGVRALRWRRL